MPFTPSHAVVALPFLRTPLVPAAIAVGAMTPDLPVFLRGLGLPYSTTHSFAWLPLTVLLALALLLVWRCVLRPATRELSPRWLAARLPEGWDASAVASARETLAIVGDAPGRRVSWRGLTMLVLSLALGVVSHIAWDLFTHEGRAGVTAFPMLEETWGPLTGYKWLQHGSSVLGLTIIGIWMLVWLARREPDASVTSRAPRVLPAGVRLAWWLSLPALLVAAWFGGLAVLGPFDDRFTIAHLAYRVLPPACAVWGVLTLLLCLVVQGLRHRR